MASLIPVVVSLANLAWQTCKAAETRKEECVRIGERLMSLMAVCNEWMQTFKKTQNSERLPSRSVFLSLEKVLIQLNAALQAASQPQKRRSHRASQLFSMKDSLEELLSAEQNLNAVLQDIQIHQGSALFEQSNAHFDKTQARFDRIESLLLRVVYQQQNHVTAGQILQYLAAQKNSQDEGGLTFQEQMNEILKECQNKPTALLDSALGLTEPTAASTMSSSSTVSYMGTKDETKEDLLLDLDQLDCDFEATCLLGEGGFSQVYRAKYNGTPVAVKRLKVHEVDIVRMSEKEKEREIRRMQAEAVVMSQCCIHPHITVCFSQPGDLAEQCLTSIGLSHDCSFV